MSVAEPPSGTMTPWCAAPFVAMEFDPFGNVQACCSNATYPLGNVTESHLDDLWHGPRARTLRKAMIDHDLSRGCMVCRHRVTFADGEVPRDYYGSFPVTSDEPDWPQLLNFSLHNTCNLACIMCGADLSSKIRSQRTQLPPLPHVYDDRFFEEIRPFLLHCSAIDLAGGEPFLVREHRRIWELIDDLEIDPVISVTTNGTVWNDHVEALVTGHRVNICISIDGVTPSTFERVRAGASFTDVMANVDRFAAATRIGGGEMFLSFSVVRQNWFELGATLCFAEARDMGVSVQTVIEPEFGVQRLPTPELEVVVATLKAEDQLVRPLLRRNLHAWDEQLRRLDVELQERQAGTRRPPVMEPPSPGLPDRFALAVLAAGGRAGSQPEETVTAAAADLAAWSDGRDVARLDLDDRGRVRSGDLTPAVGASVAVEVLGRSLVEVLDVLSQRVHGALWIGEEICEADRTIHTLWFGQGHQARDKRGLLLRTIAIGDRAGVTLLVAADLTLLPGRGASTPVGLRRRSPAGNRS